MPKLGEKTPEKTKKLISQALTKKKEFICLKCGIVFKDIPFKKRKYCSRGCFNISQRGITTWNKGKKLEYNRGINNPNWKGNEVGYISLHRWVYRNLGKAQNCSNCRAIKWVEWANKSHEYKRETNDWVELCRKCHRQYDRRL